MCTETRRERVLDTEVSRDERGAEARVANMLFTEEWGKVCVNLCIGVREREIGVGEREIEPRFAPEGCCTKSL